MKRRLPPLVVVTMAVLLAACSAGGPAASSVPPEDGRSADPAPGSPAVTDPATPPPDEPAGSHPGGGTGGDPGDPNAGGGGGGGIDPGAGNPKPVEPVPGQLDPHPVAIEEIRARVDGRHAVLNVIWTSGVEPCYVLDSVFWKLDQGTKTISVSLKEGHAPGDTMCIEIAVTKVTAIDLGELEPGTYTVTAADGIAPDITFTIA
jgi:hypothetical protein